MSKDEALDLVAADISATFLIRSPDEGDEWSDALERLAPPPPSPALLIIRLVIAVILSIAVGAQYGVRTAVIFAGGAALLVAVSSRRRKDTPSEAMIRRELTRRKCAAKGDLESRNRPG